MNLLDGTTAVSSAPLDALMAASTGASTPRRRQVKIIATVGPASSSPECLSRLLQAGVDVLRLNMSHGTHDEHAAVVASVRRLAQEMGRAVAILLDLQGPKIRTGRLAQGAVTLVDGGTLTITTRAVPGDASVVSTTYAALPSDVAPGDTIMLDDGRLELRVTSTTETDVTCTVVHGGVLREHKGINLPGVAVSAPALTQKDLDDLAFGVVQGVDYVALSFVRNPDDVTLARQTMAMHGASIPIIAKLERPEALTHLDAILHVTDGVMIARGDLGVELPLELVPMIQKDIIARANRAGVLVITATQMLESMIEQPRPTRAEVSDVANAVLDDTDVVMLSGETAVGEYAVEAVSMMTRILAQAEQHVHHNLARLDDLCDHPHAMARAAAQLTKDTSVRAVVVFTRSGLTAHMISKVRPDVPILAFANDPKVYNRLALWRGVTPLLCEFRATTDEQIAQLDDALTAGGYVQSGESVVILGSLPVTQRTNNTNFIKLHVVGSGV